MRPDRLKILHYIATYAPAWRFGGPVLSVSRLCEALVVLGHEVEVFTSMAGLSPEDGIAPSSAHDRAGVKVTYHPVDRGMGIPSTGMRDAVRSRAREFDVVHVTGVWQRTSGAACDAAMVAGVPYVISPRGALGRYSWRHKTAKKALYYLARERRNIRNAAGVHYTAVQEQRECEWLRLPGRAFVVPNPVDLSQLGPARHEGMLWRASLGIDPATPVLLVAGRLHHKKGLDMLPDTLSRIAGRGWTLVVVGRDEDGSGERLRRDMACAGLSDRARFLQPVIPGDLRKIYSAADLLLLPSRHENFGNVVVEALSCGCPAMLSPHIGLSGDAGAAGGAFIVERDSLAWASALAGALEDVGALRARGESAAVWARATFESTQVARRMAEEYVATIESFRRRRKVTS